MKISLTETQNFAEYTASYSPLPRWLGWIPYRRRVRGLYSADEETGEIRRQRYNRRGQPLYVSADGDKIALNDTLKVLLLDERLAQRFVQEFKPMLVTEYKRDVRVEHRKAERVEQQAIPAELQQRLEGETYVITSGMYGGTSL
jgi:hypothetical protein